MAITESKKRIDGGPYRPLRNGEIVPSRSVSFASGTPMVSERTYGGRKRRGPLPEGIKFDRRQPQSAVHKA